MPPSLSFKWCDGQPIYWLLEEDLNETVVCPVPCLTQCEGLEPVLRRSSSVASSSETFNKARSAGKTVVLNVQYRFVYPLETTLKSSRGILYATVASRSTTQHFTARL